MFAPPGNVAVCFEPLVSLAARRIIGFTARPLRPGDEVLRAACQAAARWPDGIRLGVELTPALWRSPAIGLHIYSVFSEGELSPTRLELEIPEEALTGDFGPVQQTINHVRRSGIMVALTVGGRMKEPELPLSSFDTIKFNATVMGRIACGKSDYIVDSLLATASECGVVTAAEGISSEAQFEIFTDMGFAEGQGSLFGRPVRATEIAALLSYPSIAVA
jgi:EAL domain-containing protein (putative c-di-GMP-specific phosphodiesterase class I)